MLALLRLKIKYYTDEKQNFSFLQNFILDIHRGRFQRTGSDEFSGSL